LQFAEHAGIEAYVCVNFDEDMAGMLEYLFGDGTSTTWGRQRVADGHAAPYKKFNLICSNEEPQQDSKGDFHVYIAKFKTWLNATRASAKQLGVWPLPIGVAAASGVQCAFFRQVFTLEDDIGSHGCSLEALASV
jgi:alpha-L-arabinofuranosidase